MTEIMPFPKTIYCFIGPPLSGSFFYYFSVYPFFFHNQLV